MLDREFYCDVGKKQYVLTGDWTIPTSPAMLIAGSVYIFWVVVKTLEQYDISSYRKCAIFCACYQLIVSIVHLRSSLVRKLSRKNPVSATHTIREVSNP